MALRVPRVVVCAASLVTVAILGALVVQRRSFATTLPGPLRTAANSHVADKFMIKGDVLLENGSVQYLGGLCFGRSRFGDVGDIRIHLEGAVVDPRLRANRYLLVGYLDDQPHHWQAALDNWNSLACQSLKAVSNVIYPLQTEMVSGRSFIITLNIKEVLAARHWHVVITTCDTDLGQEPAWDAAGAAASSSASTNAYGIASSSVPSNISGDVAATSIPLTYTLEGTDALSTWGPQQQDPPSCPENYWKHTGQEVLRYLVS